MPTEPNADRLRSIKRLDQLVAYLRDELDWPIESDDIEDISFTYEPEELGLDSEHAAKINQVKQIRPLHSGQPWGIFWVSFEKKRLPVVVLRRILGSLVVKSRKSANSSDRPRWGMNDLLFVSAYGDEASEQREIAFAHFSQSQGDLPTLRVLGWDGADTGLKLDHVAYTLGDKLRWPANPGDAVRWRQQWSSAFRHRLGHVVRTSDHLAEAMAGLARRIRDATQKLLEAESERGPLTKLFRAFQAALIHDLTEESFADTYAQTITYGLLTAAINRTDMSGGTEATYVKADDLTLMVRVTSPFLKEMLETFLTVGGRKDGLDFDELGIQDVVELLRGDETDLPAILRDFGNRTRGEDPVIHFYEHFLSAYNKKLKIQRGVFYTPQPVVSYIVRSVHELLQTEFGLEDGLASTVTWREMLQRNDGLRLPRVNEPGEPEKTISPDEPFVEILDPATGTATFLVEAVDVIHRTLVAKWKKQGRLELEMPKLWNDYVPKHLLPRLHGYELLAAPYAIAHLKLGLKLTETGYRFGSNERARIYLTNALEPKMKQLPQIGFEPLAHEAKAVNEIKWYKRFTVVIGNPPYSINSCNLQEAAVALVEQFRFVDGEKIQERGALKFETILQDDYVKFWGLSLRVLEMTPGGIVSMISNNGFFSNRVLRGVRKALLNGFSRLTFLDLHGNRSKGEVCPDGSPDDNVFDINQGVGISILSKAVPRGGIPTVELAELWGSRGSKYQTLGNSSAAKTTFQKHLPKPPYYTFALVDGDIEDEYRLFVSLDEAMPFNKAGFVSGRDDFAVDFDIEPLEQRISDFLNPKNNESTIRERYSIKDAGGYELAKRRQPALAAKLKAKDIIKRVQQRPFDYRFVGYSEAVLTSPQKAAMHQLIAGDNLALCLSRGAEIIRGWEHIFCTRALVQHHTVSLKEVNYVFPLNVRVEDGSLALGNHMSPNFAPQFLKLLATKLKLSQRGAHGLPDGLTAEDIFHYAYAVFHSPGYRSRYAEFLKIDFPRLPLSENLDLFLELAGLGGELMALHLLESPRLERAITECVGAHAGEVEKISWSKNTVWLDKAQTVGFKGVPEEVWNFHIGGYRVSEKWLKDRRGRALSADDRAHYQKIVVALSETIKVMAEIERVIEKHGGWPFK